MLRLFAVLSLTTLLSLVPADAPVCRVGGSTFTWTGSPADLALIEARYQAEQAEAAGRSYPQGAPTPSPWTGFVSCSDNSSR